MKKTLQIEGFLSDLHKLSLDSAELVHRDLESAAGEAIPFCDIRLTSVQLFALLIALQIRCLKNKNPFDYLSIQKSIFDFLDDQGLGTTAIIVDKYIDASEGEQECGLLPLQGVSIKLLHSIVPEEYYENLMEKKTMKNGSYSSLFMHSLIHISTKLVQLSSPAINRNMK